MKKKGNRQMPKNIKACLTSTTDDWKTPTEIYKEFMKVGYIDCFKFQSKEDELKNTYYDEKLFINPPFSKLDKITDWILTQAEKNKIALLIPARTDTKYFERLLTGNPTIYFIKGRLHYNDSKSAPFPTILLIYDHNKWFKVKIYRMIEQKEIKKVI